MRASAEGIRALWISLVLLGLTTALQAVVVAMSGSVALLGDTLHNASDALTAVPLGVAFLLARRPPTRRYTYGYGRAEDLAGVAIVVTIAASAVTAGYAAIQRLLNPQEVSNLAAVAIAALIGFAGNELVARYRMRVGRKIGSAALIADGLHARTDDELIHVLHLPVVPPGDITVHSLPGEYAASTRRPSPHRSGSQPCRSAPRHSTGGTATPTAFSADSTGAVFLCAGPARPRSPTPTGTRKPAWPGPTAACKSVAVSYSYARNREEGPRRVEEIRGRGGSPSGTLRALRAGEKTSAQDGSSPHSVSAHSDLTTTT